MKTIIGIIVALILFSSLFTNGVFAEPSNQNKTKAEGGKTLSREEKAAQLSLKYHLYKDPNKPTKPPVPKSPQKTVYKTSDGIKILTKGKGVPKKAKSGIRRG